ncbi:hypothetical protein SNE40_003347 [Patella caerulea]|uniref:Nucleotide exchange factor Fes1 domain-containing protein n=1 Tax=Patella caerulea TaxID=87958 RepID=A0AAN8KAI2_PATCE
MASSGDGGNNRDHGEPRMPKDMKGLLRLCAEVSDPNNENKTGQEVVTNLDPEKQEFLENALSDLTVNPVQRMKECIHLIKTTPDTDDGIENKLQALEELLEWCGHIDFAIDFHKIGGFEVFSSLLNHEDAELRWTCLELVADLVQNNPYCQKAVLENNILPVLLESLDKDQNSTVKTKALYALSCLCRDNEDGQKLFTEQDGFSVLMRAMQTDVEKLKIKASFMLNSMCTSHPSYKDILCDIGMVEQFIGLITPEHGPLQEHVMNALLTLITDHDRAKDIAQQPQLNLHDILKERLTVLQDKPEYQEEKEYAERILKLIGSNDGRSGNQDVLR